MIIICKKNFHYAQKLQKKADNKGVKLESYTFYNNIWLNSKYIKIKQNQKLNGKFFRLFQVEYLIAKQA